MDDAQVLATVNQIRRGFAGLARHIVDAMGDQRLSATESFQLGIEAMGVAQNVAHTIRNASAQDRKKIVDVLEHGELHMPAGM